MSDFKHAIRALLRSPGFSAVAILTVAVGIGANTALFSAYDRLVLNPVTIPNPASLVAIWINNPQLNFNAPAVSWPRYEEMRTNAHSFASIGISAFDNFTLTGNGDPEQLNGQRISSTFLPTLGILPEIGRNFTAEEDVPNGPAVCIISHELWKTQFGGRAGIIGETITLNSLPWQVVGIMPPKLTQPFGQVQVFAPRVFEVGGLTAAQVENGAGYAQPIARLKPGVSLEQAGSELEELSRSYRQQFGSRLDANNLSQPHPFVAALVGNLQPTFYTLLGAVGFVLLIACANVASLFLSRLSGRYKEIAVRQSLGATRSRVVRQFLIESIVFSFVAALLSVPLASWALSAIQWLIQAQFPQSATLALDWRALAFTGCIAIASALLIGLLPAIYASKAQLIEALKDSARGSSSGRTGRFRSVLIVSEVALSVVLLVGSTLLLLSFLKLQRTPPGFEPHGVASALVAVPAGRYGTPERQAQFFDDVIENLRAQPEVTDAAATLGLPLSGFNPRSPYSVGGRAILPLPQRPLANLSVVSERYFALMHIPLIEGRVFTALDRKDGLGVCVINESFAKRLFPGESALGKVLLRGVAANVPVEVVGVIRDVKTNGLNVPAPDEIYFPMRQLVQPGMIVIARTNGKPGALQSVIRRTVTAVDKDQPISLFTELETNVAQSLGTQRIAASLTAIFAGLALALSALGLYSVVAYAVSQRTAEIGIRMALGARPGQVVQLVMRSGLVLVGIGLVAGLAAAAGAARLIQSLLFDVQPLDPFVYGGVAILFTIIAMLACLLPSLRAARVDPLLALRSE